MAEVNYEALQALAQRNLEESAAIRRDYREMRALVLGMLDQNRRRFDDVERRIKDLRDDLELMIKAELMGRLGHFETQIEARIAALAEQKS
jgi:hypothetical protein